MYKTNLIAFLLSVVLSGCVLVPESPREAIATSYVTIDSLADSVRIAKRDGLIDAEQRDNLVDKLQKALDSTKTAQLALSDFENTGDPVSKDEYLRKIEYAQALLSIVSSLLEGGE